MPNHCHAIIRPFDGHELKDLLGAMKSITARHIHAERGTSGELWQQESYDRIIRDGGHLIRAIHYIGRNPEKSQLPEDRWYRWIAPNWQDAGWDFERGNSQRESVQ